MSAVRQDVKEQVPKPRAERLPRHARMLLRLSRRQLPAPICPVVVERGVEVPAGDGVRLIADHYRPVIDGPRPTLLVRCPYGRGFPWDYVYGALFAGQGFHVLLQSCRGTGGSGGELEPFRNDAADGQATVAWLRQQDWFTGSLGTIGASYLGYTQWALAADPPPELRAMVVQVGSDDFYQFLYPGGAFALEATLTGTAAMVSMERGFTRFLLAMVRLLRHHRRVERTLPLIDSYPAAFGKRVGYFEEWLGHPEPDDSFWAPRRATPATELVPPASLLTGWADVCLDPTLALYRRLRDAGREVRLIVGPWNHASGFNDDMPTVFGEGLDWLRAHLCADGGGLPEQPVRVWVGAIGEPGQWRNLPDWPPPDVRAQPWYLHGDGTLGAAPRARRRRRGVVVPLRSGRAYAVDRRPQHGLPRRAAAAQQRARGTSRCPCLHKRTTRRAGRCHRPGQHPAAGPRQQPALRRVRAAVRRGPEGALLGHLRWPGTAERRERLVRHHGADERDRAPVRRGAPATGADLRRSAPPLRAQHRHWRPAGDRHPARPRRHPDPPRSQPARHAVTARHARVIGSALAPCSGCGS